MKIGLIVALLFGQFLYALPPCPAGFKKLTGIPFTLQIAEGRVATATAVATESQVALKKSKRSLVSVASAIVGSKAHRVASAEKKAGTSAEELTAAEETLRKFKEVESAIAAVSTTAESSPDFPRAMTRLIQAVADAPADQAYFGELKQLQAPIREVIESVAHNPVDLEAIRKAWPGFDAEKDGPLLSAFLDRPLESAPISPYKPQDIEQMLAAAARIPELRPVAANALRARDKAKLLIKVSEVLGQERPIPEWAPSLKDPSFALPVSGKPVPKRIKEGRKLVDGKIADGDLLSYLAGQYEVSRALAGESLSPEDAKFAEAYLKARAASGKNSMNPQSLPPEQASYLNAMQLQLKHSGSQGAQFMNEWIRFLNNQVSKTPLTQQEMGILATLTKGNSTRPRPVKENDWHRLNLLTNQKTPLSSQDKDYLENLYNRVEALPEYQSLAWHITALLSASDNIPFWRQALEGQRSHRRDLTPPRRANRDSKPSKQQTEKEAQVERARALGDILGEARSELLEELDFDDGTPSASDVGRYFRDRLLGIAARGGYELTADEANRSEAGFKQAAALRKTVALPSNTDEIFQNISNNLRVAGSKPIDRELFEDVLRYQLSKHPGGVQPSTLRTIQDFFMDPAKSQTGELSFSDGWRRGPGNDDAFRLEEWLDEAHFDPRGHPAGAAVSLAWAHMGNLEADSPKSKPADRQGSKNPHLTGYKREFFWNEDINNKVERGAMRISLQTPGPEMPPGTPRTIEGFLNINADTDAAPMWVPFSAVETAEGWKRTDFVQVGRKNGEKREEKTATFCAKCHLSPAGRFDPKPVAKGLSAPDFLH